MEGTQRGWLDVVGYMEGTQKSSSWVDILRHYERQFAEFRESDIEVLEIGVQNGSSLAIWKQYFTAARFIGVDINPNCKQYEDDRVVIEIGSQDDPQFLLGLTKKYKPTIVIDDGSHLAHHIQFTFERLFPSLPPGGLYVIEDMFFHLRPNPKEWLGYSETTSPDYLFDVVRLLFTERPDPSINHGIMGYLRRTIEEISFAPLGVAFIRKKSVPVPIAERVAWGEAYALKEGKAEIWRALAAYILHNGGVLDQAAAAARKAVAMAPASVACQFTLFSVLRSQGDFSAAVAAGERVTELEPTNGAVWDFLGQIHLVTREYSKAEERFRTAAALRGQDQGIRERLNQALKAQGKAAEAN